MARKTATYNLQGKDNVSPAAKSAGTSLNKLGKVGSTAMAGVAAAAAAAAAATAGFVALSLKAADVASKQEDGARALQGTIEQLGINYETASKRIEAFATAQQNLTVFGDDESRAVFENLIRLTGEFGDATERAAKLSLDMAQKLKITAKAASRQLGQAMNGNLGLLKKQIPALAEYTKKQLEAMSAEQRHTLVLNAVEGVFGGASEQISSFTQLSANLQNTLGDLVEAYGDTIIKSEGFKAVAEDTLGSLQGLTDWVVEKGPQLTEVWNRMSDAMLTAMGHLKDMPDTFKSMGLAVEGFGEIFKGVWNPLVDAVSGIAMLFAGFDVAVAASSLAFTKVVNGVMTVVDELKKAYRVAVSLGFLFTTWQKLQDPNIPNGAALEFFKKQALAVAELIGSPAETVRSEMLKSAESELDQAITTYDKAVETILKAREALKFGGATKLAPEITLDEDVIVGDPSRVPGDAPTRPPAGAGAREGQTALQLYSQQADAMDRLAKANREYALSMQEMLDPFSKVRAEYEATNEVLADQESAMDRLEKANRAHAVALHEMQKSSEELNDQQKIFFGQTMKLGVDMAHATAEAFARAVEGSDSFGDAFVQLTKEVLRALGVEATAQAIVETAKGLSAAATPGRRQDAPGHFASAATWGLLAGGALSIGSALPSGSSGSSGDDRDRGGTAPVSADPAVTAVGGGTRGAGVRQNVVVIEQHIAGSVIREREAGAYFQRATESAQAAGMTDTPRNG